MTTRRAAGQPAASRPHVTLPVPPPSSSTTPGRASSTSHAIACATRLPLGTAAPMPSGSRSQWRKNVSRSLGAVARRGRSVALSGAAWRLSRIRGVVDDDGDEAVGEACLLHLCQCRAEDLADAGVRHRHRERLAMRDRAQRRPAEPGYRHDGERHQIDRKYGGRHRAACACCEYGKMPHTRPRGDSVSWPRRADEAGPGPLASALPPTVVLQQPPRRPPAVPRPSLLARLRYSFRSAATILARRPRNPGNAELSLRHRHLYLVNVGRFAPKFRRVDIALQRFNR